MKAAAIFYFSGTGATEMVTELIQDEFNRQQVVTDVFRIETILKTNQMPDLGRYDLIGIGNPIIAFGTPEIVHRFIRLLPEFPESKTMKAFVFKTAGSVEPINYNASKPAIRKLAAKGYRVIYDRIFVVSCNWAIKYTDSAIKKLHEVTRYKIGIMCSDILAGKERILKTGFWLKMLSKLLMSADPFFMGMVGRDYHVSRFCNFCGLCIRNCPVENIYQKKNTIKFRGKCLSCMRCVYSCPMHAINLRLYAFFIIRGGYNLKRSLSRPADEKAFTSDPWFPHFKSYVENEDL